MKKGFKDTVEKLYDRIALLEEQNDCKKDIIQAQKNEIKRLTDFIEKELLLAGCEQKLARSPI